MTDHESTMISKELAKMFVKLVLENFLQVVLKNIFSQKKYLEDSNDLKY